MDRPHGLPLLIGDQPGHGAWVRSHPPRPREVDGADVTVLLVQRRCASTPLRFLVLEWLDICRDGTP
jgi:hypothetical protein